MKNFLIFITLGISLTTACLANPIKKDILRIEFIDEYGEETIDLKTEYKEAGENLLVQVKPQRVESRFKDNDKPNVVWKIDVQAGTLSVLSNFSQIPNETGTEFNLDGKTIANYRIYLSSLIKNRHEIRFLYAPLAYNVEFVPEENILFGNSLLMMGSNIEALYKFNSYRLSYIYHFDNLGVVQFRLGFTAKIRDAETALTQGLVQESFTDIGFVPLIHIGARIQMSQKLFLDAEAEGSWAPQGYALDARLSAGYQLTNNLSIGAGVGYLDGGANVSSVNTFARLFYGYGKVTYTIPQVKKNKSKRKRK
jgi:hypothetical protein